MNTNARYAKRHYESAMELFEQGLYEKALQQIDLAIKKMPENPEFISTKGIFLHRMNDLEGAAEAYKAAIQTDSSHIFSHYNLGLIYMQQNRPTEAIKEWQAVLRAKPDDVEAIFNIAVALASVNRRRESIPFYKKVLSLEPNYSKAHLNLGVIYRDLRDYEQAKYHLLELQRLDSTYEEVVNREIVQCEEKQFIEKLCENNLKLSLEVSSIVDPALNAALGALASSEYTKALKIADNYLLKTPNDDQAKLIKGEALLGLSKNKEAILLLEAMAERGTSPDALFLLGSAFLNTGEYKRALECFERLKRLDSHYGFVNENIIGVKALLKEQV